MDAGASAGTPKKRYDDAGRPPMKIINPASQEVIADVNADSPGDVARKVDQARSAGRDWAHTPLPQRLGAIRRFKDALAAELDPLARTLTAEVGKPITQARNELKAMAGRLDFFLNETANVLKEEVVLREGDAARPALTETIRQEPLGVVANVSAWNYPYFVGSNVFVPALLTGNTVVYKPSEFATLTGQHIARLLHAAGVPAAAFIPVVGGGDVGAALVAQPVNGVFLTSSYGTGVKIAQAVAARLLKLQLELGGKDPTYVCDDVDARTAAEGLADGAFYNTGQSCCSVERIYVHRNAAPAFIEAFVETVRGFKLGDPTDESTYIGPLARAAQIEVLESQVSDALNRGARLAIGGKRITDRKGNYFQPTVLVDARNDMRVMRDESFGPIIGIQTVADDEEAVKLMNDTEYGLTAGVYTKDRARAEAVLERVDAGSVYWNCCDRVSPRLPWTGRRHSGIGSTLSREGIRTFLQPKAWHLRSA
jgi:acyl-CoA reductase-like NAD-dependent aldehyde dehydrogenase